MRWLFFAVLLISLTAKGQEGINFGEIAQESSESLDELGYHDPVFKWDMDGRVQAALNDGINYITEGTPALALPQLEEAVKLAPDLWVAHYYKGVCHKQLRQYKEAEKEFLRVNELNDKNIYNYMELGKTYDLLKDYGQGERYFERAARIDPNNTAPVYLLANHCTNLGLLDRAKRLYKNCLETDPLMLDAEVKLALIEIARMPNNKRSMKYLEDVLAKDSLHKQALIYHGILKVNDEPSVSLRNWNRLVRLSPGNTNFRFMRAMLLIIEKDYDKAFSDIRKVLEALPVDANSFKGKQTSHDKRIDIEYAGFYVVANVYGFPDEDGSRLRKAYCLILSRDFDEALKSIREVKGANTSPLCLFLKGVANEHKGKHHEALVAYDSALRYDNDNIDAHKKRGIYFLELKEWNSAEYDFTQMLRINPEAYVAHRLRGLARFNASKFRTALSDYNKYLQRDSANLEVLGERGVTYRKLNEILPSTLDLIRSRNFTTVERFDVIAGEIDKLLVKNDTAKALWWLDQFTTYDPPYIPARKLTLQLLMSQKKWPEVGRCADRALFRPGNPGAAAAAYSPADRSFLLTAKGISLIYEDAHVEAIRELTTALDLDKTNKTAYVHRARAQLKLNNKDGAAKDLQKAASLGDKEAQEMLKEIK